MLFPALRLQAKIFLDIKSFTLFVTSTVEKNCLLLMLLLLSEEGKRERRLSEHCLTNLVVNLMNFLKAPETRIDFQTFPYACVRKENFKMFSNDQTLVAKCRAPEICFQIR